MRWVYGVGALVLLFALIAFAWKMFGNKDPVAIQEIRGMASEIRADLLAIRRLPLDPSMDSAVEHLDGLLKDLERQLADHGKLGSVEAFDGPSRIDQIETTLQTIAQEVVDLKKRAVETPPQLVDPTKISPSTTADPGLVSAINSVSSKVQALDKQWTDLLKNDKYVFPKEVCVNNACLSESNVADLKIAVPKIDVLDARVAAATVRIDQLSNQQPQGPSPLPVTAAVALDEVAAKTRNNSERLDVVQANINDVLSANERNAATLNVVRNTLDDVLVGKDKQEADLVILKSQLKSLETDQENKTTELGKLDSQVKALEANVKSNENLKADLASQLKKETEDILQASLPTRLIDLQTKVSADVKKEAETLVANQIKAVNDRIAQIRSFDPNSRIVVTGPFRTTENHRCFDQTSGVVDTMTKLSWGCPANTYLNNVRFGTTQINQRQERVCTGNRGQVCRMEPRWDTGYLVNFSCCKFDKD